MGPLEGELGHVIVELSFPVWQCIWISVVTQCSSLEDASNAFKNAGKPVLSVQ